MGDKVPFRTTLDPELVKQLKILAIKQNRNVNDILEEIIKEYINKQGK